MPILQKVLVATDLSEVSRAPLRYAAALSRRVDATLTARYVSPRYASYEPFPAFPSQAALDPARRIRTTGYAEGYAAHSAVPAGDASGVV
jgi:nucleotide-binding universal stress UspA family protein